ncbi:permease-like cell division protein FtsX [Anaerotignum faecicola]|nr:permease-like cell division protein FtsX [Anaerotignum faecicola]
MRPSSIRYYFKEGFTGLLKNRLMTIASIATVAACIFIVSISVCMITNLSSILDQIEDTIGIAVFLNEDLSSDEINRISNDLNDIEHVTNVIYISPDEALEELKVEWDANGILDGFEGENNPLSHSFEISIDSIENQSQVLADINNVKGINNVRHAQTETQMLLDLNKVLGVVGVVIISILAVISVVIIMNTIKISVYTRRTEINIMKFVGATDWFIRWPFIIEGILIGLIGAAIPMFITWPLYDKVGNLIIENFPIIQNVVTFVDANIIFAKLLPASLIVGCGLGVFGSVSSIRKYLMV